MGSHKHKKKYESDSSSSESEASSSSNDSRSKGKKRQKKSRESSSEESENEKTYKSKSRRSPSVDSDSEKTKKKMKLMQEPVDKSTNHRHKERDYRVEKNKEEKYEERYKDKYKSSDTDRFKDRGKSRDRDIDESRNRRDSNNRERYENKRQDYRRDDRRAFRYQGNSRDHRDNSGDYRGRGRGDNRDRKNNNRREYRGRRSSSFDHANAKWGKNDNEDTKSEKREPQDKEKPNFGLTGKLTEETNTFKGVVIKYSEPPEARKPRRRWRLYPFKGEKALQTLYIHRESAYLIGRERKVVDLPVDHPSCSKQHAALQYRLVPFTREDGSSGKRVRPYLIDLESANGTFINNKKIETKKYVELFEKDVIKFGFSSREYVLLHENSKDEAMDDDVKQEEEEVPIKEEPE